MWLLVSSLDVEPLSLPFTFIKTLEWDINWLIILDELIDEFKHIEVSYLLDGCIETNAIVFNI